MKEFGGSFRERWKERHVTVLESFIRVIAFIIIIFRVSQALNNLLASPSFSFSVRVSVTFICPNNNVNNRGPPIRPSSRAFFERDNQR